MLKRFTRYVTQSVAGMIGISVYVLADTFFISVYSGADGLAILNLILPEKKANKADPALTLVPEGGEFEEAEKMTELIEKDEKKKK